MYNEVLKLMEQINLRLSSIDKKIFMLEKCTSKQPESLNNLVDIEALKKESSETQSLTNTCVNILKQIQSYMDMDNPDDTDPENFEDYDRDGDEDDNMDEGEFDEDGYLLNPTDAALNKLAENWGN
ncbi:hypothetical protein C1645_839599 [Glomus cerebriforme]|uniref:Uncharacterized protein n=1 Tax=Glomus cerebriforme TaxID=658196 RepID=A0A397S5C0_9GLOM|nr:hypothetical protein C1645_839599 [Glomus cerebriforme]